jgi:molybdopterin-guanine dinucleotide biosynthesis protein B
MRKIVAVIGYKKSGKTGLIERLVKDLTIMGYKVAVIKHIHHGDFEVDIKGKDTWRFKEAGAVAVAGVSNRRLYINISLDNYPDINSVIDMIGEHDIIFLEGFKDIVGHRKDIYKVLVGDPSLESIVEEPILGVYLGESDYQRTLNSIINILKT